MFREMRRKKQQLPENEALEILKGNSTCTLALISENGYPYSLPISYSYNDGKIYFHGAKEGHKYDAIKNNDKISLSIINDDNVIQEKYTNKYKSVIVFGKVRILEDIDEIKTACRRFAETVCPNALEGIEEEIAKDIHQTAMYEVTPEHITGKEGLEFFKLRK